MFGQFEFLENSRATLLFAKNMLFKDEIGRDRPMNGRLAINDRDHASVDRNGAIKSHLFDHRSKVRMRPRCAI